MTAGLSYAPIPRDQKVLVVGVVSGNLGDYLENHDRVVTWHRDDLFRNRAGWPVGVGRVLVTKFIPHGFQDRLKKWNQAERENAKMEGRPPLHVIEGFGGTGELKAIVYQSLGEHHPKHNPTEAEKAQQAAIGNRGPATAMAAALVKAALPAGTFDETAGKSKNDPVAAMFSQPPAVVYNSWADFLERHWVADSPLSSAAQGRELYPEVKRLGLTKASEESFATMCADWVRKRRPVAPPSTLEVQARQAGATDPGPILSVVDRRAAEVRAPKDSTAGDAEALLQMIAEAKKKAQEVVAVLEMAETAIPGLVDGLAAKERRIEAAIAALRNL